MTLREHFCSHAHFTGNVDGNIRGGVQGESFRSKRSMILSVVPFASHGGS
jgi:hypothetical protein